MNKSVMKCFLTNCIRKFFTRCQKKKHVCIAVKMHTYFQNQHQYYDTLHRSWTFYLWKKIPGYELQDSSKRLLFSEKLNLSKSTVIKNLTRLVYFTKEQIEFYLLGQQIDRDIFDNADRNLKNLNTVLTFFGIFRFLSLFEITQGKVNNCRTEFNEIFRA